jgi:8-oxo-dGTP pyrophosphatase MutT (NUDIX family)
MKNTCGFILYYEKAKQILIGHVTNTKDMWTIPKGKQELGETPFIAALRETSEEANVSEAFITSCMVYTLATQNYGSKRKRLHPFLAVLKEIPANICCPSTFEDSFGNSKPELDEHIWVNIDELIGGKYNIHHTQIKAIIEAKTLLNATKD